jgi:hypothetical protein
MKQKIATGYPKMPNITFGASKIKKEDTKLAILTAIRKHCVECVGDGGFDEVKFCPASDCVLWPYRFGQTPRQVKQRELLDKTHFQHSARFGPGKTASECRTQE